MFLHAWQLQLLGEAKIGNVWLSSCSFAFYLVVQLDQLIWKALGTQHINHTSLMHVAHSQPEVAVESFQK